MVKEKIDSNFLYYFDQGKSFESYQVFGSHLIKDDFGHNIGVEFALYAPNAKCVNILAEFNNFEPWLCHMDLIDPKGIWYKKIDGNFEWQRYKYEIILPNGDKKYKADPYAFFSDLRPGTDSKIYDIDGYYWNDSNWMNNHEKVYDKPMLIYELHLGSWRRKGNNENDFYKYNELVNVLIPYLKQFGYTHIEFMPVYEHPLDASWGYQGTGYYSPTARYGVPKDLMYLIDKLHQNNIGVIFDWVPGHICKDAHGLYMFDGTPLYEYSDEGIRENVEWGTANLDLGKGVTKSFLISNAMYYVNYFHADGFRVDAVSNIIFYMGDKSRGENVGATGFLKDLSLTLFKKDDRLILSAEDSSDFAGVTKPVDCGGLGFNYKWDMGWMNDTLEYFKCDPLYRKEKHNKLSFSMIYNYNEQFILPLSHDEVVHMKGSILNKMPGDYWQKFANYRLLMGYLITHPGKKLLFMGDELAPFSEWAFNKELDWNLLEFPSHDSASRYMKDLTKLYTKEKALFELDHLKEGFSFIEADNRDQSIYIYARFSRNLDEHLIVVLNCTPNTYKNYRIGVIGPYPYREILNSDTDIYGGSNQINLGKQKLTGIPFQRQKDSIMVTIPPLGITIFKMDKED